MKKLEDLHTEEVSRGVSARILDRFGLVYGEGMREYGETYVGVGIPLFRRSTLEASQAMTRNVMAMAEETQIYLSDEA